MSKLLPFSTNFSPEISYDYIQFVEKIKSQISQFHWIIFYMIFLQDILTPWIVSLNPIYYFLIRINWECSIPVYSYIVNSIFYTQIRMIHADSSLSTLVIEHFDTNFEEPSAVFRKLAREVCMILRLGEIFALHLYYKR